MSEIATNLNARPKDAKPRRDSDRPIPDDNDAAANSEAERAHKEPQGDDGVADSTKRERDKDRSPTSG